MTLVGPHTVTASATGIVPGLRCRYLVRRESYLNRKIKSFLLNDAKEEASATAAGREFQTGIAWRKKVVFK